MDRPLLRALERQRAALRRRWVSLLRAPASELELGEIAVLLPLLDPVLDELYASLRRERMSLVPRWIDAEPLRRTCSCGRNPLLAFFLAGESALVGTFARFRSALPADDHHSATALAELHMIFRQMAGREVESYCAGCPGSSTGTLPPFATTARAMETGRAPTPSARPSPASPPSAPRGGPGT